MKDTMSSSIYASFAWKVILCKWFLSYAVSRIAPVNIKQIMFVESAKSDGKSCDSESSELQKNLHN